jgi:hypothetical protein
MFQGIVTLLRYFKSAKNRTILDFEQALHKVTVTCAKAGSRSKSEDRSPRRKKKHRHAAYTAAGFGPVSFETGPG